MTEGSANTGKVILATVVILLLLTLVVVVALGGPSNVANVANDLFARPTSKAEEQKRSISTSSSPDVTPNPGTEEVNTKLPEEPPQLPAHETIELSIGEEGVKPVSFYKNEEEAKAFIKKHPFANMRSDRPYERVIRPPWEKPDLSKYLGDFVLNDKDGAKRNLVFLIYDDLRCEVPPFVDPSHPIKAPNWERLGKMGIAFARAYTPMASCVPTRDAIFFGQENDVLKSYDFDHETMGRNADVLMNYLEQNGYNVASVGKVLHQKEGRIQIGKGINTIRKDHDKDPGALMKNQTDQMKDVPDITNYMRCRGGPGIQDPNDETLDEFDTASDYSNMRSFKKNKNPEGTRQGQFDCRDEWNLMYALEAIKEYREQGKPFALFFGITKPHSPLRVPKYFHRMYKSGLADKDAMEKNWEDAKEVNLPPRVEAPYNLPYFQCDYVDLRTGSSEGEGRDKNEDFIRIIRELYYGAVSYGDWILGRILDSVDLTNTIVMATADHGWRTGDQGQMCKNTTTEAATRVPLTIYHPGLPEHRRGQICWQLVELIDLYPTITEFLDIPTPKHVTGKSLVPLFRNIMTEIHLAARSIYGRCTSTKIPGSKDKPDKSGNLTNDRKKKRINPCNGALWGAVRFLVLGYSVRTKDFRFGVWFHNSG